MRSYRYQFQTYNVNGLRTDKIDNATKGYLRNLFFVPVEN